MKAVILAGGFGTRISEETETRPKPMIEIGEKPIIWHIMKLYSYYGHNDFIICCGYKQHLIKEWFANYYLHNSDVTLDEFFDDEMQLEDSHDDAVVDHFDFANNGSKKSNTQKDNFFLNHSNYLNLIYILYALYLTYLYIHFLFFLLFH
mgnify:CR=1 FL=1